LATWDGYRHREQRSGKELEQEWQEKNQENSTNQVAMGEVEGAARGTSTRKPYPTSTGKLATGSPRHEFGKNGQEKNQENSTNQVAMGEVEGAARGTSTRKPFRRALENWQQSTSRIARDRKQGK